MNITQISKLVDGEIASLISTTSVDIRSESRLVEDLGLDEIDKLALVSALAEALQLDIAIRDAKNVRDVGQLVTLLHTAIMARDR